MSVNTQHSPHPPLDEFCHEAFLYEGIDEFLEGVSSFILEGLEALDPILVVVDRTKIAGLKRTLGPAARHVDFANMAEVGRNPARIIPVWREFVTRYAAAGTRVRGVGEPVFPERNPAEVDECERHEALLNVAFMSGRPWRLLCPYDTATVGGDVLAAAARSHPFVREGSRRRPSEQYRGPAAPFAGELSDPPASAEELAFDTDSDDLAVVRSLVASHALRAGLTVARSSDLVLAANELATNSLTYGGGGGRLRIWRQADAVVCDVGDDGHIDHPLVGRLQPGPDRVGGRGLWLVNQLCDLVQIRSSAAGTVVRVWMYLHP